MHALIATALLSTALAQPLPPPPLPAPETGVHLVPQELAPERQTNFVLSFSPISTFMLGAVLEGEFRMAKHFTGYLAGEFYGLWLGWGVQSGVRWYPSQAFNGFFMDLHGRASDLLVVEYAGGGLELGSQHRLGRSRWNILWSIGADVGVGRWSFSSVSQGLTAITNGTIVPVPKLRLMLGYAF